MAFSTGSGARVAIGKESTWGTPVPDTMLMHFTSEGLAPEINKIEEESLLAAKAAAAYDLMGIKVSGDISGIVKPEMAGFLMKAALGGTDTVTPNEGGVTGQAKHEISLQGAASPLPSYTIMVDRKVAIKRYSGCRVESLKLSAKAGDYVRFTLAVKGKDESTGTIVTTTPPSKKAYKFVGATLTVGGESFEATGIDLDIANQLEEGPQTNVTGIYHSEPMHGKRKVSVAIEKPYDANAEAMRDANLLTDAVISSIVLHLESPAIIAATSKYRMDITLRNVAVLDAKTNVGGPGILTTSITGEATAVGADEPITAVIYDNQATAY
jgi:hypothetical protein